LLRRGYGQHMGRYPPSAAAELWTVADHRPPAVPRHRTNHRRRQAAAAFTLRPASLVAPKTRIPKARRCCHHLRPPATAPTHQPPPMLTRTFGGLALCWIDDHLACLFVFSKHHPAICSFTFPAACIRSTSSLFYPINRHCLCRTTGHEGE
jgi:hypothetical protein